MAVDRDSLVGSRALRRDATAPPSRLSLRFGDSPRTRNSLGTPSHAPAFPPSKDKSSSQLVANRVLSQLKRHPSRPGGVLGLVLRAGVVWLLLMVAYEIHWLHQVMTTQQTWTCPDRPADHVIFLAHGWISQPDAMDVMAMEISDRARSLYSTSNGNSTDDGGPCVLIHKLHANWGMVRSWFATADGIDSGGRRIASEMRQVIASHPSLRKMSLVAHSMGGVYGRYALGTLLMQDDQREKAEGGALIAGLRPVNFVTMGSPHAGVDGHFFPVFEELGALLYLVDLPFALGDLLRRVLPLGAKYGRTFTQLFLRDGGEFFDRISDPNGPFFRALARFQARNAIAAAEHDYLVPCASSTVLTSCPFEYKHLEDPDYPHVIATYATIADPSRMAHPSHPPPPEVHECPTVQELGHGKGLYHRSTLEHTLVTRLAALEWTHTIVRYQGFAKLFAHQLLVYMFRRTLEVIGGKYHEVPKYVAEQLVF
ncbi:unnamed protein product [Vitrella brassicaformis CCMP3155]|uniref:DUF676 domain-containing protein n=1 Tax=Vitrella brassicaformis (strain CCMP3155) TaxID=1169540 RepID=A0A0G4GB65_VITBC|nr:unnamed protein product [Vitrella brassicaformis CCMP3155]|eukprot:CEM26369.1 unnamed protein product [Vitrella brassicaformis CCMP3155]